MSRTKLPYHNPLNYAVNSSGKLTSQRPKIAIGRDPITSIWMGGEQHSCLHAEENSPGKIQTLTGLNSHKELKIR